MGKYFHKIYFGEQFLVERLNQAFSAKIAPNWG